MYCKCAHIEIQSSIYNKMITSYSCCISYIKYISYHSSIDIIAQQSCGEDIVSDYIVNIAAKMR